MAVTSCTIHRKRSSFKNNGTAHTVWYFITTDDKTDDPVEIYADAIAFGPTPLPAEGERHPNDLLSFVMSVDIDHRQENDFNHWVATVQYGGDTQIDAVDPLNWQVQYRIDYKIVSRAVTQDAYGNTLTNTARDPIMNPPRQDFHVPILVAEKNYSTLDEIVELGREFDQTANDSLWFGAEPGQAQFEGIRAGEQKTHNGITYYPTTVSVAIDYRAGLEYLTLVDNLGFAAYDIDPGWIDQAVTTDAKGQQIVVATGPNFNQSVPAAAGNPDAQKDRLIGDNGEPLTAPIYLTAGGKKPAKEEDAADPTIYQVGYDLRHRVNYSLIGIGG